MSIAQHSVTSLCVVFTAITIFFFMFGLDSNGKLDNYFIYYTYKFEYQPPVHELYHPRPLPRLRRTFAAGRLSPPLL